MDTTPDQRIVNLDERLAIPRKNGELLFEAPWEARVFGLAVALNDCQTYVWRDFSQGLAAEIAAAEQQGASTTYYERWLTVLEKLVMAKGLLTPDELQHRVATYAAGRDDEHHGHPHHRSRP